MLTQLFSLSTSDMTESQDKSKSTMTVLILFFLLIGLIVLLILLYKKLNKEANGEYTIRRMIYKEGGVRDRMRGAVLALETRLGVQLWPRSDTDEDGEEMQEVQDEEGQVEEGDSQQSDSEEDDQEEDEDGQCSETEGKGDDTSGGNSSLECSKAGEETRLIDQSEAKGETGENGAEKEEKVEDGEGKCEASGGTGLLIDLKQFSGSAIWSEEGEGRESDVTAL